jgi:N-acetylmuramic acid 6-phosphate etherase
MKPEDLDRLLTERANPRTRDLDLLPTDQMLLAINEEDRGVAEAVRAVIPALAKVVDRAAEALRRGGRLHYFGAGTSGRLGVLDASEIPPTFGVDPGLIQAHMAGGREAVFASQEGVEDDEDLGARDADAAGLEHSDVAVALTASGRTPYCLGVLKCARGRGAFTVAVTGNRPTPCHALADVTIDPLVGEEVLSGSTRMKAGTAQKLILNMLSTGVMVRLGRTYGNLMVGVTATNHKLCERAARLVSEVTGTTRGVREALVAAEWDVRCACIMLKRGVTAKEASRILEAAGGSLRRALEQPASLR